MMPSCKMNETKLEVSESYEEADLSDVDDDVFVRSGGRNGYCLEYDIAKKPLMTPRKKSYGFDNIKNGGLHTEVRSSPPALKVLCMPMCYIMIATFAMLGLVAVITFLTNYVSWPLSILNLWTKPPKRLDTFGIRPCDNIHVEDVWVQHFPKLLTESAFRLLDVNNDTVDDIVFGYATGADGYGVPDFVCDIYFAGQNPCFGGVLALDGRDGSELWRHWTPHEVYAINCREDITGDNVRDCLVAGRAGVFCAISGRDGTEIWHFEKGPAKNPIMNVYTAQFIRDLNNDGVVDILAVHGGDPLAEPGSRTRLSGRILILSGKTGEVLQYVDTPDGKESYYSPQILTGMDGSDFVLFGTGGETHAGGLYVIALSDLYNGAIKNAKLIYQDEKKGVMIPPVITDITGDGVDDIVMAMFNSTVVAFDGSSFQQIWNHTFPSSETYTTPTPGFFNEDEIPDFLVKYQTGPGFPLYYHSQTTVLDGKTGKPFLENPIIDTIGSQSSTPLIRAEGYGNDIFLYWSSNCKGFEGNSSEFSFKKGTNVHEQSRSDLCKLRFDSKLVNQLRAFNRATGVPGFVIYDSEERLASEYSNMTDTSQQGQTYLQLHPEMWQYFDQQQPDQTVVTQTNYNSMGRQDVPDTIPSYPATAMMPGAVSSGNVFGFPLGVAPNIYDLSSQPEMTEEVKYPMYHAVRKHGNYGNVVASPQVLDGSPADLSQVVPVSEAEVAMGMSNGNGDGLGRNLNINLNRRQYQSEYTGNSNLQLQQHQHHSPPAYNGGAAVPISGNRVAQLPGSDQISPSILEQSARDISGKSFDNLWSNYYPDSRSNDVRRNSESGGGGGMIVEEPLIESDKYAGNDLYEKRSGGGYSSHRHPHFQTNPNPVYGHQQHHQTAQQQFGESNVPVENPEYLTHAEIARKIEEQRNLMLQRQMIDQNLHQGRESPQGSSDFSYLSNGAPHHHDHGFSGNNGNYERGKKRRKRHIGPHDNGGIQRLISTGTLAKSLNDTGNSIDLVFATYWFYPAKTQIISAKSKECIEEKMSMENTRFDETNASCDYGYEEGRYSYAIAEWPRASDRRSTFHHGMDTCGRIRCLPFNKGKPGVDNCTQTKNKRSSGVPTTEATADDRTLSETKSEGTVVDTETGATQEGSGSGSGSGSEDEHPSPDIIEPEDEDDDEECDWRKNLDGEGCENFCDMFCKRDRYKYPLDACLRNRPPWRDHLYWFRTDRHKCRGDRFRQRVDEYFKIRCKKCDGSHYTRIIVDEKYHVIPSKKKPEDPKKRPLWGFALNQWEIDEENGLHDYHEMRNDPPYFPIPTYFQPLRPILPDICAEDDKKYENEKPMDILTCIPYCCPRRELRAVYRDYRGKRPRRSQIFEVIPTAADPFLRKLLKETEEIFQDFLLKKVPIIWIYGRPIKSIAHIRRKYCLSLAETHGFTYLSMDEEIALLAQKGVKAIEAKNHKFEGFTPMERLALPIILKLVAEKDKYTMSRQETMDLIKFIILNHHPAKGYIIDGYPWDEIDNVEFEKTFYPITVGLYFLDSKWTEDKTTPPDVIPPLYFRRSIPYDEYAVEDACTKLGLKTLKIIGTESLLDEEDKIMALHAVVDEYLDAYDEVLEGNLDSLQAEELEFETFGETQGYGVNLDDYLPKPDKDSELSKSGEGDSVSAEQPQDAEERKKYLELDPLKRMKFETEKGIGKYTPSQVDVSNYDITPSQKLFQSVSEGKDKPGEDEKEKAKKCDEDDEECKKKKKKRRKHHRCRCRCRCHRRNRRSGDQYDDEHDYLPRSLSRSPGRQHRQGRGKPGMGYDDGGYDSDRRSPYDPRGNYRGQTPDKNNRFNTADSSAPDEDMGEEGPLVYDPRWGFTSTRRAGKHPNIHLPKLDTPSKTTPGAPGGKGKPNALDEKPQPSGIYALPPKMGHGIPDPYNTIPHKQENKPRDFLQDYPGPKAPDRFGKVNRAELPKGDPLIPSTETPLTEEPTAGLRSFFSDTMSRVIAKNQADIRKIKYDKLKKKVAQVEYEIYQDDYRLPKYRFYKKYKDYTPEDFIKEQKNWIPCANCFDSYKEADKYYKQDTPAHQSLSQKRHEQYEADEEREYQQRNKPFFNKMVSCLCGEDNEAGLHVPGFKPEAQLEDNEDLEKMDELSNYKKRKEFPT